MGTNHGMFDMDWYIVGAHSKQVKIEKPGNITLEDLRATDRRANVMRPHTRSEMETYRLIDGKLREIANETIYLYSQPLDATELYRMLISPGDYQTMVDASMLMPSASKWMNDNIKVNTYFTPVVSEYVEYSLNYKTSDIRIQWLWPRFLNSITLTSELGLIQFPLLDMGIQWQTTIKLHSLFFENYVPMSMTMHMLPWLKFILPDLKSDDMDLRTHLQRCLALSTPRNVPGVSEWFGQVCKYGSELISLYNLTRKNVHKFEEGQVKMVPVLVDELIETGLRDHFNEFYNELKNISVRNNDKGVRDIQYGP